VLQGALETVGFRDVHVARVDAPAIFASTSDAVSFQRDMAGELIRLLEDASDLERVEV
jgi:hypothetical protein